MLRCRVLQISLLVAILGCARGDAPATPQRPSAQQSTVLVVGDGTAADVATQLRNRGLSVTDSREIISSASLIVIAQDASVGPMPIHRELAQEIGKSKNHKILWVQTNSSLVDDQELLELEELEAREILNSHGLPGDTAQFAVDSESAPVESEAPTLKGWTAIQQFVSGQREK